MTLSGVNYYYIKNAQGDVVRICDESGNIVITYNYDAWGNLVNFSGSVVLFLANPFRYRGYYYNLETGFYYLNSRYYDPAVGRFINADGQLNSGIIGCNAFAYCNDNPIIYSDYYGNDAILIFKSHGAAGFGHAGVLIQKSTLGGWTYFSVSDKDQNKISVIDFKGINKDADLSSIQSINASINQTNPEVKADYNSMHYLEGSFTVSWISAFRLAVNPQRYKLLSNNCVQNTAFVLSKGEFKCKDAEKYTKAMNLMMNMTIPNSADYAFTHFKSTVVWYDSAKWYQTLFTEPPYHYFYNSIYVFPPGYVPGMY